MATPNYHLEHSQTGSASSRPLNGGEYIEAEVVAADATGSSGAAFMLGASAAVAGTKIFTPGGDTIVGTDLVVSRLYEVGVEKVYAKTGNVIIFKRQ